MIRKNEKKALVSIDPNERFFLSPTYLCHSPAACDINGKQTNREAQMKIELSLHSLAISSSPLCSHRITSDRANVDVESREEGGEGERRVFHSVFFFFFKSDE